MANVRITYTYSSGDEVEAEIHVDDSFPDCVDEARAQAVRAVREITGIEVDEG